MCNLQELPANGNPIQFTAAVGKGPARQTQYGISIDVVRTDGGERVWGDLIPTNLEILRDLRCGACIEVPDLEVIRNGRRPTWRGRLRLVER